MLPTWTMALQRLVAAGVSPEQVQVLWVKQAIQNVTMMPGFPTHAETLREELGNVLRAAMMHFPNLKVAYVSSRTRAYTMSGTNPEPWSYENGWAVRWLIEDQMNGTGNLNYDPAAGPVVAPWIAWGPYLWADGTDPRSDGFVWECSDVVMSDFTHPSGSGEMKVAEQLLAFFKTHPTAAPWFLSTDVIGAPPTCAPSASATSGNAPLTVSFTANGDDPDGIVVDYAWTYDDGTFATVPDPTKTFHLNGVHDVRLTVTDSDGNVATCALPITVGGSPGTDAGVGSDAGVDAGMGTDAGPGTDGGSGSDAGDGGGGGGCGCRVTGAGGAAPFGSLVFVLGWVVLLTIRRRGHAR